MASSVDPEEQSDLGLQCLPRPVCPIITVVTLGIALSWQQTTNILIRQSDCLDGLDGLFTYEPRHEKTCLREFVTR